MGLNKNITLKDIAKDIGFSVNTVSRALNNKDDISETTKTIVKNKAKELGYVKNSLASSLRSNKSKTISVIIGDISNPFFGILVKEIEIYSRQQNYNVFIMTTEEKVDVETNAIKSSLGKKVDGIILCPNQQNQSNVSFLNELNLPYVLIGRKNSNLNCDYVIADDKKGGFIATEYLINKGHKNILFFNGPDYNSSASLRLEGYKEALIKNGININHDLIREISITGNISNLLAHLNQSIKYSSIIAFSDLIALELISIINQPKFSNLKNIDIIGFDNIQSSLPLPYSFPTINYDKQKMARLAVDILMGRITKTIDNFPVQIVLDVELIMR